MKTDFLLGIKSNAVGIDKISLNCNTIFLSPISADVHLVHTVFSKSTFSEVLKVAVVKQISDVLEPTDNMDYTDPSA